MPGQRLSGSRLHTVSATVNRIHLHPLSNQSGAVAEALVRVAQAAAAADLLGTLVDRLSVDGMGAAGLAGGF